MKEKNPELDINCREAAHRPVVQDDADLIHTGQGQEAGQGQGQVRLQSL